MSATYNNVFKTAKQKQYELGKAFADTNKRLKADDGDAGAAVRRACEHAIEVARTSLASQSEILDIQYALNSAGLSEKIALASLRSGNKLVLGVGQAIAAGMCRWRKVRAPQGEAPDSIWTA